MGPEYSEEKIKRFLEDGGIPAERLEREQLLTTTAKMIEDGHVVGWFQGRMEFGPRALGSRSILGDPRSADMQSIMNLKIKYRESFRPFAPSVLQEHASGYFDLSEESPYMLLVAPVSEQKRLSEVNAAPYKGLDKLKAKRSQIPAVTHVDCSARIQTVHRDDNPLYYDLIQTFYQRTGCPVMINTSFNVRGEPIVCTPVDAYRCFMRTQMDYLVMGPFLLDKRQQKPIDEDEEWQTTYVLD
jgi:carbamoyltransferase